MYVHLRFYNIIDKNYLINKLNMKSSEKFLKILSGILENSILNSQDTKNEIKNSLKFQRDKLLNSLKIVSKEEFYNLKKIVQKQEKEIKKLKKKKSKKAR